MEESSVSHNTFRAVSLQSNSVIGTAVLTMDFFKTRGRRAKVAMFWTILAGTFVLLTPTWLSAMTGYTTDIQAFVLDKDENLIPASKFRPVIYIIHDGARLGDGRQNDTLFAVPWSPTASQFRYGYNVFECASGVARFNQTGDGLIEFYSSTVSPNYYLQGTDFGIECKWMWSISKYVFDYGFLAMSTELNTIFYKPSDSSNFTTRRIFNPPLNVSAHFLLPPTLDYWVADFADEWSICPFGRTWQNPSNQQFTFNFSNPLLWDDVSDTSYASLEAFNRDGSCQQKGEVRYQWGFSFLLLFAFIAAFLIWTIGIWALYIDSWLHSRLDVSQRDMGIERAVLDISDSLLSKVERDDIKLHGNHKLQALAAPNMLTFSNLPIESQILTRWTGHKRWWHGFSFKRWMFDEKWWLCAMLFFDVMLILSWTTPVINFWLPYLAFMPGLGVFWALLLGRGVRGRYIVFVFWFSIFIVVECCWLASTFGRGTFISAYYLSLN